LVKIRHITEFIVKRVEDFEISLEFSELSEGETERVREFLRELREGDTLTYDFKLTFRYFNEALRQLEIIDSLLDLAKVTRVKTRELRFGKAIIQDVLNKLELIEKRLKK